MSKHIYTIGGSKGGVGKSLIAISLIDYLIANGKKVLLIETDTSNPDVYKMYEDTVDTELINLDDAEGWINLVNTCDKYKGSTIVINTAARSNDGVVKYGQTLQNSLDELKRELTTLWIINRQRDSLELLSDYRETFPTSTIHVLKNGHFGEDKKFELYNGSNIKEALEKSGGKSLLFPDLADRVTDSMYIDRLSINKALETMPIGNRAEINRWKNEVKKVFKEIIA